MRIFKAFFLVTTVTYLGFLASCANDGGEIKLGKVRFSTSTTGTIDPDHKYLITFSGLVGDLEIPNGVQIGPNVDTLITFNRVGESLRAYLSNIPMGCTPSSSGSVQLLPITSPNDPDHPEAEYGASILVPIDGSEGTLAFTIACPN